MPGFVHRERVRFGDLDAMRHVNNAVLPGSATEGLPLCRESEDGRGWFRTSDLSRVKRALSR